MEDKKITLRLNNKKQTGFGIASFILSITSLILLLCAINLSAFGNRLDNSIVMAIGIIEIIGFITCLIGIVYGFIGEFAKDKIKTYAHIGISSNLFLMIFHAIVIVYGFWG
jgi:NADH:ubiquinone oxidoreductase subunit 6 (subunit J)